MFKIGIGIMASGKGRRMGENKLLIDIKSKKMVEYIIEKISQITSDCRNVDAIIVSPYKEIEELGKIYDIKVKNNPYCEKGKSESVKLITRTFEDCDGIMFIPGDQIFVKTQTIVDLISVFVENKTRPVALSVNDDVRSPIIFPRAYFENLMMLEGDNGGRLLIKEDVIKIPVEELECMDIDNREELDKYADLLDFSSSNLEYSSVFYLRF